MFIIIKNYRLGFKKPENATFDMGIEKNFPVEC